jgi:hypothetical protein
MQHLLSTELNQFIDYSSFDDSINFEELVLNKHDNQLTLAKLFALLRLWNNNVHKYFAKLIFLVCEKLELNNR